MASGATHTRSNSERKTYDCPYCGTEQVSVYIDTLRHGPNVCFSCESRATDSAGRGVYGNNVSMSGGFVAYYRRTDDKTTTTTTPEMCEEVTNSNVCFIDGTPCYINERRFGGTYIAPLQTKLDKCHSDVKLAKNESDKAEALKRLRNFDQMAQQAVQRYTKQQHQQDPLAAAAPLAGSPH